MLFGNYHQPTMNCKYPVKLSVVRLVYSLFCGALDRIKHGSLLSFNVTADV